MLAAEICSPQNVAATETALNVFRVPTAPDANAWMQFKKLVEAHGKCTDGALGEYWDDIVTQMFDKQWEAALHFEPLRRDQSFRAFVSNFGGETVGGDAVRRVVDRAKHCAQRDSKLCGWIHQNFTRPP